MKQLITPNGNTAQFHDAVYGGSAFGCFYPFALQKCGISSDKKLQSYDDE